MFSVHSVAASCTASGAMKAVVLWAVLLGVMRSGDCDEEFSCAANLKSIKFNLRSFRNKTGQWNAQVSKHTNNLAGLSGWF
jgi:hypothetical protein